MQKKEKIKEEESGDYLKRPRINSLLLKATKKPLTIVCAGMGCGKSRAVYDFFDEYKFPVLFISLSEMDNVSSHFWENVIRVFKKEDKELAEEIRKLGFPNTENKLNVFFNFFKGILKECPYMKVFDDFHLLKNPEVLAFIERIIYEGSTVVLISRTQPQINISGLLVRDNVSMINEDELNFTENEISQFLLVQGLKSETGNLHIIYEDTKGWAFIVNYIIRSIKLHNFTLIHNHDSITHSKCFFLVMRNVNHC